MENPYYEIMNIIKGVQGGFYASSFLVKMGFDTEENKPFFLLDGEKLEGDFYALDTLSLTEEDAGCTLLCTPLDEGFLLGPKLAGL